MFHDIVAHDNGTFAYHGRSEVRLCGECGGVLDKESESLDGVRIRRLRDCDISFIYDGEYVVSERFRQVCEANNLSGTVFIPLPDDPGFYVLRSTSVVEYDSEAAGAKFGPICSGCGKHVWSTMGEVKLRQGSVVPDRGFARTDMWFASISGYDERYPILLCGDEAARILRSENLKGLEFTEDG